MNANALFSDGIPYAVFDGVSGNLGLDYDLTDLVDQETGFTIEFLFKCPSDWSKGNMYNDWMITKLLDNTDNLIEPMLESYYQSLSSIQAYVVNTENNRRKKWIDNSNSLPTNSTSYHSWSHLAITVRGNQAIIFSNGNDYNNIFSLKTFTKPIYRLLNCLMYEDNYTRKTSKYQVTQFAVWNYPRYTSDFTVQNKLIIDKNYVV